MPIDAGALRERFSVQRRESGFDDWGSPKETWEVRGQLLGAVRGETGMGAIRSGLASGIPQSVARYSVLSRARAVQDIGVDPGMRLVSKRTGQIFSVTGVVVDYEDLTRAYITCEVGGNDG